MNICRNLSSLLLVCLLCLSCGSGNNTGDAPSNDSLNHGSEPNEVLRQSPSRQNGSVITHGHTYNYTILREPCDTLPVVVDDDGSRYADNVYTLSVSCDGTPWTTIHITKADLARLLTPEFMQKGILEGLIYDDRQQGLRFRALVSFPESDVHMPLIISLNQEGRISFERDLQAEQDE